VIFIDLNIRQSVIFSHYQPDSHLLPIWLSFIQPEYEKPFGLAEKSLCSEPLLQPD